MASPILNEIVKYEPMAMVTFKDGSSALFIPRAQMDAVGEAVNATGKPLVHIGNRWVDRFSVKEIVDLADYDASMARGWLPLCPSKYRVRLLASIERNKENTGYEMKADSAQWLVQDWIKADNDLAK